MFQSYLRDPRLFGRELLRVPPGQWVVMDEIQRLPGLLNEVHRFIEDRGLRFILLGSSARKLKQAGTNLLAGRALRRVMPPFLPEELGADFDLAKILRFGCLPAIWNSALPAESLEAYVHLYLSASPPGISPARPDGKAHRGGAHSKVAHLQPATFGFNTIQPGLYLPF